VNLSSFAKDALREVGNIGSSHSAGSLSELLSSKVEITPPVIDVIAGGEVAKRVGEEQMIVSAYTFGDEITGTLLFFYPLTGARAVGRRMGGVSSVAELDSLIQEVSRKMADSFARAISDFFSVEVRVSSPKLDESRIGSVQELLTALGMGANGALFFSTSLQDSTLTYCHLFFYLNEEDVGRIMNVELQGFEGEPLNFSELIGSFEKVFEVEERVNDYLEAVTIPAQATREFLRSSASGLSGCRVRRLLEEVLTRSGIGERISLEVKEPLKYVLRVEGCNVCRMVQGGACHTTSTAVGRFFMENMKIGVTVREVECRNSGGAACVHEIALEQIDVFSLLPTAGDIVLLSLLEKGPMDLQELIRRSELPAQEVEDSLKVLEYYGIVERKGERVVLTSLGEVFLTFARNAYPAKEEYEEGWDDIAEIERRIELRKQSEPEEKAPWET